MPKLMSKKQIAFPKRKYTKGQTSQEERDVAYKKVEKNFGDVLKALSKD